MSSSTRIRAQDRKVYVSLAFSSPVQLLKRTLPFLPKILNLIESRRILVHRRWGNGICP